MSSQEPELPCTSGELTASSSELVRFLVNFTSVSTNPVQNQRVRLRIAAGHSKPPEYRKHVLSSSE